MKTITSRNSLILWKHNQNGSQINLSCVGGDELYLKESYKSVFDSLIVSLKDPSTRGSSFVKLWQKTCDIACRNLWRKLSLQTGASLDALERVVNKFRGNLGEILVEMLAENGLVEFIKIGTYTPVDPENERFIDAEGLQNGLPAGIQIKNFSEGNLVSWEVFVKSTAMSSIWMQVDKKIKDEDLASFISSPKQYIVSLTDSPEMTVKRFKGAVVFLGPSWLELKKICGSRSTQEQAKWGMFKEVADEISRLEVSSF